MRCALFVMTAWCSLCDASSVVHVCHCINVLSKPAAVNTCWCWRWALPTRSQHHGAPDMLLWELEATALAVSQRVLAVALWSNMQHAEGVHCVLRHARSSLSCIQQQLCQFTHSSSASRVREGSVFHSGLLQVPLILMSVPLPCSGVPGTFCMPAGQCEGDTVRRGLLPGL